jgi:hypothetical protein
MPDQGFYEEIPLQIRRNLAFSLIAMIRESVDFALKKGAPATYEQAMAMLHDLDPELYDFCSRELTNKNEHELARLFKDKAAAETLKYGREVTPEELLQAEIDEHRELLAEPLDDDRKKSLKNYIISLEAALENLKPRRLTEHRILERDFVKVDRSHLGGEIFFEADDYVDYKITSNRFLRLRLLHPDKGEHIMGADLIYERYNLMDETVRIAVLQYKVWDDNGVLYLANTSRDVAQMSKLKIHFCDKGFCAAGQNNTKRVDYRFPYCCAFLRPTDRMQSPDSKMISSGIHIPICGAFELRLPDFKIVKENIRASAITHDIFEHLFNHNLLGSRRIPFKELEAFYKDIQYFDENSTIKIYAKEMLLKR